MSSTLKLVAAAVAILGLAWYFKNAGGASSPAPVTTTAPVDGGIPLAPGGGVSPTSINPAPPASSPASAPAQSAAVSGWTQHSDPQGFRLNYPVGWNVQVNEQRRSVVVKSGDGQSFAFLQPAFLPRDVTAQMIIGNQSWPKDLLPQGTVTGVQQVNRFQATGSLRYGQNGRAAILCAVYGGVAMIYGIAAPQDRFENDRQPMVEILKSFQYTQAAAQAGGGGGQPQGGADQLQWVRWQDPKEGGFTVEVPRGWQVQGGMIRRASVDVFPVIQTQSPDGIWTFYGDANIPLFSVPTETSNWTGFREGSWYSPGGTVKYMMRRYIPGYHFAREYAIQSMARGTQIEIADHKDRPDIARQLQQTYGGPQTQYTVGEISFRMQRDGRRLAGYCVAAPQLTSFGGIAMWNAQILGGFIAPEEKAALAHQVTSRISNSYRTSEQWFAQQQQTTAATSRITTQLNEELSRIRSQSYWSTQASNERIAQNRSDQIRGIQRVQDPNSGQVYQAVAGSNYYWLPRNSDQPVGTNTYDPPPNIEVTPLLNVP